MTIIAVPLLPMARIRQLARNTAEACTELAQEGVAKAQILAASPRVVAAKAKAVDVGKGAAEVAAANPFFVIDLATFGALLGGNGFFLDMVCHEADFMPLADLLHRFSEPRKDPA